MGGVAPPRGPSLLTSAPRLRARAEILEVAGSTERARPGRGPGLQAQGPRGSYGTSGPFRSRSKVDLTTSVAAIVAPADAFTTDVMARIRDFVGTRVQWQRKLWDLGIAVALREVREASNGVQVGALSAKALKWFATSVASRVSDDPGAGDEQQRRAITQLLGRDLTECGAHDLQLELWIQDIETHYLDRWQATCSAGGVGREQVARTVSSFLLGLGLSQEALRIWITGLEEQAVAIDTPQLIEDARALVAAGTQIFETMLVFAKPPSGRLTRPTEWRDARAVSVWLRSAGFGPVRQHGGLLLNLEARDATSAAQMASEVAGRLSARGAVGTRSAFVIAESVFIRGVPAAVPLAPSRRAEVHALEREDRLLELDRGGPIDNALELLSYLNRSPDAVAAAAGWAAVESLLAGPGDDDKVTTADRLADLVACSWPRAELTTIAWARVYQEGGAPDPLAQELRDYPTNKERATRVLLGIQASEDLQLSWPAEKLAVQRMDRLVRNPRRELMAVQRRAAEALRRIYRQRNLVVHGGVVAGSTLALSLQTGAPLIGAGIDRITHAALVSGASPLAIAARARLEIERAGTVHAPSLTELLE